MFPLLFDVFFREDAIVSTFLTSFSEVKLAFQRSKQQRFCPESVQCRKLVFVNKFFVRKISV